MFTTIIQWLRRPFPFADDWPSLVRQALIGGFFVTFFLFFFRPFGMQTGELTDAQVFWLCAQYGLVTVTVAALFALLVRGVPKIFDEQQWTVGREILFTLLFIMGVALGNLIFSAYKFHYSITLNVYLAWLGITASVGIFPTIFGVFMKQLRLSRRYMQEAQVLSADLHPTHSTDTNPIITITGDNQGERLQVALADLLYIEAADNYVRVFWLERETMRTAMLRGTLKRLAEDLRAYPDLYRCHRAYMVNLAQVQQISGNAQGYKLHLPQTELLVPVSRQQHEELKAKMRGVR
jgi:hypothetical protein